MQAKIPNPVKQTGLVLNIQHFCTEDGPGIRTTVFLKGCSLRCKWCSNPESIGSKPEIAYNREKCIGKKQCGRCLQTVPQEALHIADELDDRVHVNRSIAEENSKKLATVCPTGAFVLFGRMMSVDEVLAEAEYDSISYHQSGGGLTLSGGECLLQPDFCAALLAGAHERGFTTAIETAGNVSWESLAKVLPHVDVMLHDWKLMNPEHHKIWCGADNANIIANFKKAYSMFPQVRFIARTPLIPGVNDNEEHIRSVLACISPYPNVTDYELLPYHSFGISKYKFLGRENDVPDFAPPDPQKMRHLQGIINEVLSHRPRALCS